MTDFGRTALLLAAAIDASPEPLDHGPSTYVPMAGNLVPGWTLALLALTLTLPAGLASIDGLARAKRRRRRIGRALWWSGLQGPASAGGAAVPLHPHRARDRGAADFSVRPRPLPDRRGRDRRDDVARADRARRLLRDPGMACPSGLGRDAAAPALGLVCVGAVLLAWLPIRSWPSCWCRSRTSGCSTPGRAQPSLAAVTLGAVISCSRWPSWSATIGVGSAGITAPWQLLLMVGVTGSDDAGDARGLLLVGCLVGVIAVARGEAGRRALSRPAGREPGGAGGAAGPRSRRRSGRISYHARRGA